MEQADGLDCEIIVASLVDGDPRPLPMQNLPQVSTLQARWGRSIGDLRLSAIEQARGEIVAFLEDHVTIGPGYLLAIVNGFSNGCAAVGPAVTNANPNSGVSGAVHLIHYGLWNPFTAPGEVELLPGNNSAYRRSVLGHYGDRLQSLLLTDSVLQIRLRADGYRLWFEPTARLNHLNATVLKTAMVSEYLFHRCFVAARRTEFSWSRLKQIWAIVRTPLTPWVRLFRLAQIAIVEQPSLRRRFLMDLPTLVILQHAAAWGQFVGLLLGHGETPRQFTEFELDYPRPT